MNKGVKGGTKRWSFSNTARRGTKRSCLKRSRLIRPGPSPMSGRLTSFQLRQTMRVAPNVRYIPQWLRQILFRPS